MPTTTLHPLALPLENIAHFAHKGFKSLKCGPLTLIKHTFPLKGWQLYLTTPTQEDIDFLNEELPKFFGVRATSGNRAGQQWHLVGA